MKITKGTPISATKIFFKVLIWGIQCHKNGGVEASLFNKINNLMIIWIN